MFKPNQHKSVPTEIPKILPATAQTADDGTGNNISPENKATMVPAAYHLLLVNRSPVINSAIASCRVSEKNNTGMANTTRMETNNKNVFLPLFKLNS